MITEHIAPNRIISLTKGTRRPTQLYRWMEGRVYYHDAGIISRMRDTNYTLEWGFFEMYPFDYKYRKVSEEELIDLGYLIEGTIVYYRPWVEIKYEEGSKKMEFDSDSEMESAWIRLERLIPNAVKIENGKLK